MNREEINRQWFYSNGEFDFYKLSEFLGVYVLDAVVFGHTELAETISRVGEFFEGDYEKTRKWFFHNNPMLGSVRPIDFIKFGEAHKIKRYLDDMEAGYYP